MEIIKTSELLLNDVSGYKRFNSNAESVLSEMKKNKQELYQDWCDSTISSMNDASSNISLQTNGKLMELNHKDGKLDVLYGDKLVTLLREVRQLQAIGFKIPPKIDECAKVGQRFYKHGIVLKQVGLDRSFFPKRSGLN